jgi:hypothetical protein
VPGAQVLGALVPLGLAGALAEAGAQVQGSTFVSDDAKAQKISIERQRPLEVGDA